MFIASLPVAAQKHFLPRFPAETLEEGDVLATNDPEIGTGHLPDVTMLTPIFKKGRVVAYAGSIAHLPDIGGAPLHSEASDIFEEGIRFPIVKLHKAGVPNQDVLDIIMASVRLPAEVQGDLESMVAANAVMDRELLRFLDVRARRRRRARTRGPRRRRAGRSAAGRTAAIPPRSCSTATTTTSS